MKGGGLSQKSVDFWRAADNISHNTQVMAQYAFSCFTVQDLPQLHNATVLCLLPALAFNTAGFVSTVGPTPRLTKPTHYESVIVHIVNHTSPPHLPIATTSVQDSFYWHHNSVALTQTVVYLWTLRAFYSDAVGAMC